MNDITSPNPSAVDGGEKTDRGIKPHPTVLSAMLEILEAHRWEFKQARTYQRMVVLAIGMMCALARHTVTQGIQAIGGGERDWTAWYRLFQGKRFKEEDLTQRLFEATLQDAPQEEPYVTSVDATQIVRSSQKLPGSSWLPAVRTAIFRRGLHRAQRFVTGAWLPRIEHGFTRAIPLRFLSAFTAKAVPASDPPRKEWEAGLQFVAWIRQGLDAAGRMAQRVVVLADGAYDKAELWRGLPDRVVLIVRTAKNRVLREMPGPYSGRGRRAKYGPKAPTPTEHLQARTGWTHTPVQVRGRTIMLRWKIRGCYLRECAAACPVFLLVIGGATWQAGKRQPRRRRREPAFYLIGAVQRDGVWQLPFEPALILAWVWQRSEIEVTHRDLKAAFGVGQMQCWNRVSAILSVQWMVWLYAVMMLAGYRTWGWFGGSALPCAWWSGPRRWSFNTLWRTLRSELWVLDELRPVSPPSPTSGLNLLTRLRLLCLSARAAARA